MQPYIATYRVEFHATSAEEAVATADKLVDSIAEELDDEHETIVCTQITDGIVHDRPEELLINLRSTRNALIRTRSRQGIEAARGLQEVIQSLEIGDPGHLVVFDYGRFADIVDHVLQGRWPL